MSRTTFEIKKKTKSVDEVLQIIKTTLKSEGYNEKIVDGEIVWAKGDGVIIKMQCLSTVFTEKSVIIQGWTKDAILGEAALGKNKLTFPRKNLEALIDDIKKLI